MSPGMSKHVLVLGCGVNGLCCALVLQQHGYTVDIWAKDLPPHTTSNKAAAFWYPFSVGPVDRVRVWAARTLQYYEQSMSKDPSSGVLPSKLIHVHASSEEAKNFILDVNVLGGARTVHPPAISTDYVSGLQHDTLVINTDLAMQYLMQRFISNGGRVSQLNVTDIKGAFAQFSIVVNCTGLGSRELFNDPSMYAARGQVVLVRAKDDVTVIQTDEHGKNSLGYVVPRHRDIVLGGTYQVGNESLLVSAQDTADILRKTANMTSGALAADKIEILGEKVGLRPCRPEVRLEAERFGGNRVVVHNYGHGGAGWSLCWGCAEEVVSLVDAAANQAKL